LTMRLLGLNTARPSGRISRHGANGPEDDPE
jgi:hypothetical protein